MKMQTTLFLSLFVFALVTGGLSQAPRLPVDAKTGDIATGAVESERENTLYLNTTPCKPPQQSYIVVFHIPYVKTPAGAVDCNGHHFDLTIVRKQ